MDTKNKFARANGIKTFQQRYINWSTLSLGKVHLNHIITKIKNIALIKIQKNPRIGPSKNIQVSGIPILNNVKGDNQPPRKTTEATILTINIFAYSLKKNIAHLNPEYSVIHPATNSDSASGISNGVLFVSAKTDMK